MKRIIAVLAVLLIFVMGCQPVEIKPDIADGNVNIETDEGNVDIDVDSNQNTVTTTVNTEEGEQTTTITGTAGSDDWCPEGGNWNMESTGAAGDMNAEWKIDKIMTSGEYEGLCHVVYTANTPQGAITTNYYFAEGGETGYFEMNVNGQTIKQSWSAD